jgi:hypothetical protein
MNGAGAALEGKIVNKIVFLLTRGAEMIAACFF